MHLLSTRFRYGPVRGTAAAFLFLIAAAVADDVPPKPAAHTAKVVEGWTIQVDDRLLNGPGAALGARTLELIRGRLADIQLALPADKIERLQQITIWLDRTHGALKSAQYHPSGEWLKSNGYDVALARGVHIPDAEIFSSADHQRVQPWSVLHELAHAYHDQVLDFEQPEIKAAWERFRDGGRYEKVLHIKGHTTKHYALTNQKEFFAEMSEAYLGVNDFFPFNRAELQREEPEIYALLGKIWAAKN